MPLPKHTVQPVRVSQVPVPGQAENELEFVANATLCNLMHQMASISQLAANMFDELTTELAGLAERTMRLQNRLGLLHTDLQTVQQNDEDLAANVPLVQLPPFSSKKPADSRVLSRNTIPPSMRKCYEQADPAPPLDKMDELRDDRRVSMKLYSDPDLFFDLWSQKMLQDPRHKGAKRKRAKPRQKSGTTTNNKRTQSENKSRPGLALASQAPHDGWSTDSQPHSPVLPRERNGAANHNGKSHQPRNADPVPGSAFRSLASQDHNASLPAAPPPPPPPPPPAPPAPPSAQLTSSHSANLSHTHPNNASPIISTTTTTTGSIQDASPVDRTSRDMHLQPNGHVKPCETVVQPPEDCPFVPEPSPPFPSLPLPDDLLDTGGVPFPLPPSEWRGPDGQLSHSASSQLDGVYPNDLPPPPSPIFDSPLEPTSRHSTDSSLNLPAALPAASSNNSAAAFPEPPPPPPPPPFPLLAHSVTPSVEPITTGMKQLQVTDTAVPPPPPPPPPPPAPPSLMMMESNGDSGPPKDLLSAIRAGFQLKKVSERPPLTQSVTATPSMDLNDKPRDAQAIFEALRRRRAYIQMNADDEEDEDEDSSSSGWSD